MATPKEIPPWLKELWKEFTTPPNFLNVPKPGKSNPKPNARPSTNQNPDSPRNANPKVYYDDESEEEEEEQPDQDTHVILRANGYHPMILEQYPFVVHRAVPSGSIMRLDTSNGTVALKRSRINQKRLQFIWNALQYIEKNGFTRLARIIPNHKNTPFTFRGEQVYYVSQWIEGQPADFSSMVHVAESASAIAEFHRASRRFESTRYNPPGAFGIEKVLQSRAKEFDLFLSKARTKRKPNAVDRFVIRYAPVYKKQAQQAAKLLEDPRCRDFIAQEEDNPGLCHLDITPQNLIYTSKNRMYLIDFDLMSYGPRMLDIGHMIRRSLQANDWKREPALIGLVQVNSVEPLRHAEYRILQAILTFPHSFWRACRNHYMNQPTPYTLARLEQLQEQEQARQSFLEDFASHVERHKGN